MSQSWKTAEREILPKGSFLLSAKQPASLGFHESIFPPVLLARKTINANYIARANCKAGFRVAETPAGELKPLRERQR